MMKRESLPSNSDNALIINFLAKKQKISIHLTKSEQIPLLIPSLWHLYQSDKPHYDNPIMTFDEFFELTTSIQKYDYQEIDRERNEQTLTHFLQESTVPETNFFQRFKINQSSDYSLGIYNFKRITNQEFTASVFPISNPLIVPKIIEILNDYEFVKQHQTKFDSLTPREKEVLGLLVEGCNNPQIADILNISRNTVENHRKKIIQKLETKNLVELIHFARAFNLNTDK